MATEREQQLGAVMTLGEHLEELRRRIIVCLIVFAMVFLAAWLVRHEVIEVLKQPHVRATRALELDTTLKFSKYFEAVVAQLIACAVVALVVSAPVLIYQVWAFVSPGLFPGERRKAYIMGGACIVCFFAGVAFAYFFFVPFAFRYLLRLSGAGLEPVLMIGPYLSLLFLMTFAMGIAFQTPVVIYHLLKWNIVSVDSLKSIRKGVVLGAFVVGAFFTPPDPLTQIMMAVTLIILFDLGVLLAAPRRDTLFSFLRFSGVVAVAVVGLVVWSNFRTVATVTALQGQVSCGATLLERGESLDMKRDTACRVPEGGVARVRLAGGAGRLVYLAEGARLTVQSTEMIGLSGGEALVENGQSKKSIQVNTAPVTIIVRSARAEVVSPDPEIATVSVFRGDVSAKTGEVTKHISAGHTATFRVGGEPADLSGARQRWQQRIGEEEENP